MTGSAISMMILGMITLWGGAAVCISISLKRR